MAQKLKSHPKPKPADRERLPRSLAILAALRRDAILEAIAKSATELLRSSDLWESLSTVVERIGHATGVDRVHIFQVDQTRPTDQGSIAGRQVWSAPGVSTPPNFREMREDMGKVGLASWAPKLARGEIVTGRVRDFEGAARELFDMGGVKSVLCVPVFADDRWWGHIGFDDCRVEREWSSAETDTFQTLAELIGAAVSRTRHRHALADSNRIVENSPTLLYRLDAKPPFSLIYLSQNVRRYGYNADELLAVPNRWIELIGSEAHPKIAADISALVRGAVDSTLVEFPLKKPDGSNAWFEGRGYALRDERDRLIAIEGILTDITERKAASEKIVAMARTDFLTGLANRAAFMERLDLAFARAKRGASPFAIHYLDLDRFKDVNDTQGHPVGDGLLQAVADRLRNCVRAVDMVARFGGDEFAVLQDEIGEIGGAEALAAKIGDTLAAPFSIDGNHVHVSASIGIVPYCVEIDDPEAMMTRADLALYRAKEEGGNRFRFHAPELDQEVRERVAIGNDLRLAVERDEFELFYQPIVNLADRRVAGAEALLRWRRPEQGLLAPAAFLHVLDRGPLAATVGDWTIRAACAHAADVRRLCAGGYRVSVNLFGAQFLDGELVSTVMNALDANGLPPDAVELEITENIILKRDETMIAPLQELRNLGVGIAFDDYGTGYASLSLLKRFPLTRLKIDQSFVQSLCSDPKDAAVVRSVVMLASEFGLDVVAEGIEREEQEILLRRLGCARGQGYLYGRPMPAKQMLDLFAEQSASAEEATVAARVSFMRSE